MAHSDRMDYIEASWSYLVEEQEMKTASENTWYILVPVALRK